MRGDALRKKGGIKSAGEILNVNKMRHGYPFPRDARPWIVDNFLLTLEIPLHAFLSLFLFLIFVVVVVPSSE